MGQARIRTQPVELRTEALTLRSDGPLSIRSEAADINSDGSSGHGQNQHQHGQGGQGGGGGGGNQPVTQTVVFTTNSTPNYSGGHDSVVATTVDTYFKESNPTGFFHTAAIMEVTKWEANNTANGFLKFDLSSIPAGATIDNVILRLKTSAPSVNGDDTYSIGLFQVLRDWIDSQLNFNEYATASAWAAAGARDAADVTLAAIVSKGVGPATNTWHEWTGAALVQLVQNWHDGVADNFGIMLERDDIYLHQETPVYVGQSRSFHTSEAADTNRPELVITYTA